MRAFGPRIAQGVFSCRVQTISGDSLSRGVGKDASSRSMDKYLVTDDENPVLSMTLACKAGRKLDAVIVTLID